MDIVHKKCQCSESVPDTFVLFLQSLIHLFMKRQLKHHSKTAPSVRINSALNTNSGNKCPLLYISPRSFITHIDTKKYEVNTLVHF